VAIFSAVKRRPGQKQLHCERLEDRRLLAGDGVTDSLDGDDVLGSPDPLPPLESGSVHGRKWEDLNADGHQNDGEPGLAEVTIYSDRNFNGRFDTDEPHAVTMRDDPDTDFDETGLYSLENLRPGFHMVREIVPDGYQQTFPSLPPGYQPPPWGDANAHVVFVDAGATVEGLDFGNQRLGLASVHGRKWEDLNGNGQRDAVEPGISGVIIYADLNYNGALDDHEPHTVTRRDDQATDFDEGGLYALQDMRPGRYVIREVVPEGYRQTFPRGPIPLAPERPESEIEVTGAAAYTLWRDALDTNKNDDMGKADMNTDGVVDHGDYDHWKHNFPQRPEIEPVPVPPFPLPSPGGHDVFLKPGETVDGIDFGNQHIGPGSIHGIKWLDKNGNGQQDRQEPGLSGVTIYVDLNRNGVFNDDEPHTVTMRDNPNTDFDETGMYELEDLRPGWHVIREIVPAGYHQTFPHGPIVVPGPNVPEETASEISVTGAAAYTLWRDALDSDNNDQPDRGDANTDGIVDHNDYDHWKRNFPGQPNISPFPIRPIPSPSPGSHFVNLEPGQTVTDINFGNQMIGPSLIRGLKWLDENGNGRRDPGEPGLPGVTIYSDRNFNSIFDSNEPHAVTRRDNPYTRVDETGTYWLRDLRPGWHVIREVVPDGFRQTYPIDPAVPDPSPLTPVDPFSPIDFPEVPVDNRLTFHSPTVGAHVVYLAAGQVIEGIDFGNQKFGPGSVHGIKWLDENGNRKQDENEPGLPGVTIYADQNHNGVLDTGEPHTVTMQDDPNTDFDETGRYWLDDLQPGFHMIREVVPDGHRQTFPRFWVTTDSPQSETDIAFPIPIDGYGHHVLVRPGHAVHGIDFGNQKIETGSVHGIKWLDENGNGEQDEEETGLPGVTIYADTNLNNIFDTGEPHAVTLQDDPQTEFDESGRYLLDGLSPGWYLIREIVPDGYQQTFPDDPAIVDPPHPEADFAFVNPVEGHGHVVIIRPGESVGGIDFGNQRKPDPVGSIHGIKWLDENGNGAQDQGEPGLPGVTIFVDVNLNSRFDTHEPHTKTMEDDPATDFDESGQYVLKDLPAGEHYVNEVVPFGFVQTFPSPAGILIYPPPHATTTPATHLDTVQQKLNTQRQQWQTLNLRDYIYHFERICFCSPEYIDPGLVHVVGGEIDSVEHAVTGDVLDPSFFLTVDDLFDEVQAAIDSQADEIIVEYDGIFGNPTTIDIDFSKYMADDEMSFRASDLRVIPDPGIGAHKVNLEPGDVVEGIDFGNQKLEPGSIHGIKWLDKNGNGTRERNEPGLPGVTIYIDSNRNGMLDTEEPHTQTAEDDPETSGDESGRYEFEDLSTGVYLVREVVPDGYQQTFPRDEPGPGSTTPTSVEDMVFDLFAKVTPEKIELALQAGETEQREVSITLLPYFFRAIELDVMASVPDVELVNLTGTIVNGGGGDTSVFEVQFTGDGLPHAFDLQFVNVESGTVTGPTIPVRINSPASGGAHRVFVYPGAEVRNIDFGNQQIEPGSVHGIKWLDENGDGQHGSTEPGVPGVTIYADFNRNGMLDNNEPRTQTMEDNPQTDFDETGRYGLTDLPAGEHWIAEVVPDGFVQTFPSRPVIAIYPPPPGGGVHEVKIEPGDTIEGIDFGNRRELPAGGSVHGIKWLDENGNREHDPNEPGMPGVIIYVDFNRNGVLDDNEPRTKTMEDDPETDFNESGRYGLRDVPTGEHWISEVVPPGFVQTFPSNPIIAIFPPPPGGGVHEVKIEPGDTIERIDFGNKRIEPGEVHGTKWTDYNGNGQRDSQEPGLPGVTIYSDSNFNGQLDFGESQTETMHDDSTTDFDEAGMYWLQNLSPGVTSIREIVPGGFMQTYPSPNAHSPWERGAHFVAIEEGGSLDGLDFGNRHLPIPVPEEPVVVVDEITSDGYQAAFEELPLEPSSTAIPATEDTVPASLLLDTTAPPDDDLDALEAVFGAIGDEAGGQSPDTDDLALNPALAVGNTWDNV